MSNYPLEIIACPPPELQEMMEGKKAPSRRVENPWKQMSMEDLWSPASSQESDTKGEPP